VPLHAAKSPATSNTTAAIIAPTYARVSYGETPWQVMDVWLAKSDSPAPIAVYIHGGAWEGGSRGSIQRLGLRPLLDAGISVVAIDYRLITPAIKAGIQPPVRWPMGDAARAIQFIRSKAAEWNLDKKRMGLMGGSAGACTSLWMAMHDDMADPKSTDPIARESTRVSCVAVYDAQTSLDPKQLREWFKNPTYGAHAFGIVKKREDGRLVSDMEACFAAREHILQWIKEYSPIEHVSADDPPITLIYTHAPELPDHPQLDSVHGAAFGIHLKERLDALGVECHVAFPVSPESPDAEHIKFLIQKLTGNATAMPRPEIPASGALVYSPHPHFRWHREGDVKIDEVHRIQISHDERFENLACDDRLEVVSRFVPVKPLEPGKYWWRVRRGEQAWSEAVPFEIRKPDYVATIHAGSAPAAIERTVREAAAHTPALVNFEPGEYAFESPAPIDVQKAEDLILDGRGAKLVLGSAFLRLTDCRRVTVRNFTVTGSRPGHTQVRVLKTDPDHGRFLVKPEPGYDPDVPYYFKSGKAYGGSFLGCMDSRYPGREIPGALVSVHWAHIESSTDEPGAFAFSPVPRETLALFPVGASAMVTAYRWAWLQFVRGEECTISNVTTVDLPGAFTSGGSSAKSYLSCKVRRRSPKDNFGGHSATGSGRVGEWVENCEFEYLPDDGPAEQSFRTLILRTEGEDSVVIGGGTVQEGDRVSLVDLKGLRGLAATVLKVGSASGEVRVKLNAKVPSDWQKYFLYVDAPSNEDFVYRHNRHFGGKGHGVKFNGTRGWIADSTFENINGNAILAGYISGVSGHGASDVVISGNTVVRCGWTPIWSVSESGLASNLIIRGNKISDAQDAAIAIAGYCDVVVSDNEFSSSILPARGAWIVLQNTRNSVCKSNRFPVGLPQVRTESKTSWDNNRRQF